VLARPPALPAPAPAPRAEAFPSLAAAAEALVADPGGVIAFGEIHQTRQTAGVRSALARFTDEILPVLAPRAAHLVVETWVTTGACGETEQRVTEDVARTTERPAETENEIVTLLKRAKALGVAPHVLAVSCDEYAALAGGGAAGGGAVDYDKLLSITTRHLARAIEQALALPRGGARPFVIVYGGALHNDLHPDPALAKYSFGPGVFALARGAYREVDLYVPEMVAATPALRAEPWYRSWRRAGAGKEVELVRRSAGSAILLPRAGSAILLPRAGPPSRAGRP
jgi:hypothetical protein